ncbi:MAG TPA: hypothetical protein VGA72_15155, partial [Anaerolineales bacterium]
QIYCSRRRLEDAAQRYRRRLLTNSSAAPYGDCRFAAYATLDLLGKSPACALLSKSCRCRMVVGE